MHWSAMDPPERTPSAAPSQRGGEQSRVSAKLVAPLSTTPPPLAAVGVAATVLLAALIVAAVTSGLTVGDAVADIEEYTDHRFVGIASTVGILVWAAIATICAFTAIVLDETSDEGRLWHRFFLASAALAALLLIDDLLLVHEFADDLALVAVDFEPTRARKNLLEAAVFGCYGVLALIYGWTFRGQLRQLDRRPLGLGLGLLGLSFLIDMRLHHLLGVHLPDGSDGPDLGSVLEEGPKFLGIVYLAVFAAQAGQRVVVSQRGHAEAHAADRRASSSPTESPVCTEGTPRELERR
jgi:hypothetical protein